jgi:hypothetical protein
MNSNKFLHREKYIRIGGVLLLLSPIFNFLMSFALTHNTSRGWSFGILWILLRNLTWASWGLSLSSMIVGGIMLKGRRSTWAFVLLVLGFYLIWDCIHFTRDARDGGYVQPILALAINCGLFVLVYLQEFHQQMYGVPTAEKAEPAKPETIVAAPQTQRWAPPVVLKSPVRVDFEGVGPWARITSISKQEVRMQSLYGTYPQGLESYTVELQLQDGSVLRARFSGMENQDFIFKCLAPASNHLLERWSA